MASSTSPGSRPSRSTIRSYSESVRPSWRWRLDGEAVCDMRSDRFEDLQAVRGTGQRIDRVLGVGHQPEHVAPLVADPGDVVLGPVRILTLGIAEHGVHRVGRIEAPGGVLDRDGQPLTLRAGSGEG